MPTADEKAPEKAPWETHNAHPLAIRKRVYEEEIAKDEAAAKPATSPAAERDGRDRT